MLNPYPRPSEGNGEIGADVTTTPIAGAARVVGQWGMVGSESEIIFSDVCLHLMGVQ